MGTINYGASDYITLGVRPYGFCDFEADPDFMKEIRAQVKEYGGTVDEAIYDYIYNCYGDDLANITSLLNQHDFKYYHISIKSGYYEGFYLDIESNYGVAFDSWQDKREAQKEITEIKQFLIDCAGCGLVACYPGWCTGYDDYKGTIKAIKAAVKEMRGEARTTPTWAQYEREAG